MSAYSFGLWLRNFQADIVAKDPSRKILLLLDNASSHVKATKIAQDNGRINNIEVVFLPKNSTSVTQPLDAGIIAVFKRRYRESISLSSVNLHNQWPDPDSESESELDSEGSDSESDRLYAEWEESSDDEEHEEEHGKEKDQISKIKVTNLQAWGFIVDAWNDLYEESIRNCFRHVPIIGELQKQVLSSSDIRPQEVIDALNEAQQNVIQQARIHGIRQALLEGQELDSEDEADGEEQLLPEVQDIVRQVLGGEKTHLNSEVSKLLDGSPFLDKSIEKLQRKDAAFMSKFLQPQPKETYKVLSTYADVNPHEELLEEDPEDRDYIASPQSYKWVQSQTGTPKWQRYMRRLRDKDVEGTVVEVYSSGGEDSTYEERSMDGDAEEPATGPLNVVQEFVLKEVLHNLTHASELMVQLPSFKMTRQRTLDLLADCLVPKEYSSVPENVFHEFQDEQDKTVLDLRVKKASLLEEIKKLDARFPPSNRAMRARGHQQHSVTNPNQVAPSQGDLPPKRTVLEIITEIPVSPKRSRNFLPVLKFLYRGWRLNSAQ